MIDIPTGQPLTVEGWQTLSTEDTAVAIFLTGGWRQDDLANLIPDVTGPRAPVHWMITGEPEHGFFEISFSDIDRPLPNSVMARSRAFVRLNQNDDVTAVMLCTNPGRTQNPSCRVTFQTATAEGRISQFRANQLPELDAILSRVEEFVACLPWAGE